MNPVCETFDGLVKEFFEVWFRYHPDAISNTSRDNKCRLPPVDDDEISALTAWLETALVGLEELTFSQLDETRQRELRILFGACQLEYADLLERDWRRIDPSTYIHSIMLCMNNSEDPAPVAEFLRHARGHLSSFPEIIPQLWIDTAKSAIRELEQQMQQNLLDTDQSSEQLEHSLHALQDFHQFIIDDLSHKASGDASEGTQRLSRILKLRYLLPEELNHYPTLFNIHNFISTNDESGIDQPLAPLLSTQSLSVRNIFPCDAMQIAWNLYSLWLNSNTQQAFENQLYQLLLLARVDLEFHAGQLDQQRAEQLLQSEATFTDDQSRQALLEISRNPARQLAGLTYFRLLQQIASTQCNFKAGLINQLHGEIQNAGAVPLPLIAIEFEEAIDWPEQLNRILNTGTPLK